MFKLHSVGFDGLLKVLHATCSWRLFIWVGN